MGVSGDVLKRILRTAGRNIDLAHYKNGILDEQRGEPSFKRQKLRQLRIGLDVSNWISRAAHGNGGMLVDCRYLTNYGRSRLERGEETEIDLLTSEENRRNYVELCAKKVLRQIQNLEQTSKADIIVVFDGASPPIKKGEVCRRKERKRKARHLRDARNMGENNEAGLEKHIRAGKAAGAGACYGFIIQELLQLLREQEITFMVAPYEADGQLAYLSQIGAIDLVITEDSDLLCQDIPKILFKYDWTGSGILIQHSDLGAAELRPRTLCLMDFSTTMLAVMFTCIGCDYCRSLPGVGSVKARNIVCEVFLESKNRIKPVLRCIFDLLYANTRCKVSEEEKKEYEACFLGALFMYQHPVIFCLKQCCCILANNPPNGSDPLLLDYEPYALLCQNPGKLHELVGHFPEQHLQVAVVEGWINPFSFEIYPNVAIPHHIVNILFDQARNSRSDILDITATGERELDMIGFKSKSVKQPTKTPEIESEQSAAEDTQESRRETVSPDAPETRCAHLFSSSGKQENKSTQPYTQLLTAAMGQVKFQQSSQGIIVQHPSQNSDEKAEDSNSDDVEGGKSTLDDNVAFKDMLSTFPNIARNNVAGLEPSNSIDPDELDSDATWEYPYEFKTSLPSQPFLSPLQQASQTPDNVSGAPLNATSQSLILSKESHFTSSKMRTKSEKAPLTQDFIVSGIQTSQSSGTSSCYLASQSSTQSSVKRFALLP